MVASQTISWIPGPSFDHNLCRCPNGSCKAILDIYTLRPFQRYQERSNVRCFGPCNHSLSFWESRRTPKSHFLECEWQPHNSLKVGLRHSNSSKDPKVGPKMKQQKKQKVGAHSLTHNTLGVGGCAGAPGWD